MSQIILKEENIRKAHEQGCRDVKKVLEMLCPELFKEKYPCYKKYTHREGGSFVVYFTEPNTGLVVLSNNKARKVGTHNNNWVEPLFAPVKGIRVFSEEERNGKERTKINDYGKSEDNVLIWE